MILNLIGFKNLSGKTGSGKIPFELSCSPLLRGGIRGGAAPYRSFAFPAASLPSGRRAKSLLRRIYM